MDSFKKSATVYLVVACAQSAYHECYCYCYNYQPNR